MAVLSHSACGEMCLKMAGGQPGLDLPAKSLEDASEDRGVDELADSL